MEGLKTRLEAVAAIAGLAALVQFVGGAIMYFRFEEEHIPAVPTVAILPQEMLFVLGARILVPVALVGALAALALYSIGSPEEEEETEEEEAEDGEEPAPSELVERWRVEQSEADGATVRRVTVAGLPTETAAATPKGKVPPGFWPIVILLALLAGVMVGVYQPTDRQLLLLLLSFVFAFGVGIGIAYQTATVGAAAWSVFLIAVLFGTAAALIREVDSPVELDLGAVQRISDESAPIGGYFVARTGEGVYLITQPPDRRKDPQVVFVKNDDVKQLRYGPSRITVNPAGYARGQRLAAAMDAKPAKVEVTHAKKQSLLRGRGVVVTVSCDERCRISASAAINGRRTGRQVLTPYRAPEFVAANVPTTVRLRLPSNLQVRDAALRARVVVAVRDAAGNRSQKSVRLSVTR